jgi:cobalt-zinc-cadmium efflux system outer membrane protein
VAKLRQALHLPPEAPLDIEPVIDRSTLPETADLLVATIEQCHPELDINRHQIMRNDAAAELARLDYFPDVNLGFSWHAIRPTGLSPVANGEDAYSLMVGVNLPVYKQKRDAAVAEAQSRVAASNSQYASTLDQLRADVETAYAAASEHGQVLKILNDELLEKSEQTFDLSLEAYRVDRIGYQQLIDAYEDFLRLRIAFHLRTARREQAIATLERAVGCAIAEGPAESPAPEPLPIPGSQ